MTEKELALTYIRVYVQKSLFWSRLKPLHPVAQTCLLKVSWKEKDVFAAEIGLHPNLKVVHEKALARNRYMPTRPEVNVEVTG
ncbi:MAG: hypothetical protein V2I33_25745, partial [Kangiellaceae bacterium]|nr:hypothetical protein [Kangiellaceae bacterium]